MSNVSKQVSARLSTSEQNLLNQFPESIYDSFSDMQKHHITKVFSTHFQKKHKIDLRGTVPLPFLPSRFYFVLLAGKDKREITRQERSIAIITVLLMILLGLVISMCLGVVALYLLKSALGINLFDQFSLGLWSYLTKD